MIRMLIGQDDQHHQDDGATETTVKVKIFSPVIIGNKTCADSPETDSCRPGCNVQGQTERSPIALGKYVSDDRCK
jgi:hypothetical protein